MAWRAFGSALGLIVCVACSHSPNVPTSVIAEAATQFGDGGAPGPVQRARFGPLADLAGRSFATLASDSGPGDTQFWYWDLGGSVLVSRHVLTDGSYGGASYVYAEGESDVLRYVYITNGGFSTQGTYTFQGETWQAEEAVTGHPTVQFVRSSGRIIETGEMVIETQFLTEQGWQAGETRRYIEIDAPQQFDLVEQP